VPYDAAATVTRARCRSQHDVCIPHPGRERLGDVEARGNGGAGEGGGYGW